MPQSFQQPYRRSTKRRRWPIRGTPPHPSSPPQPLSTLSHRPLGQSPYGWHTATRQSAGAKKRTEGPNRGSDQQDQQDNTQSNNARKTAASTPAPASTSTPMTKHPGNDDSRWCPSKSQTSHRSGCSFRIPVDTMPKSARERRPSPTTATRLAQRYKMPAAKRPTTRNSSRSKGPVCENPD